VIGILALLIPVLGLFTLTTASLVPVAATVFCWGFLAFALVSPLQIRVVNEATQAPNLASTFNQGAFNLGKAAGAWVGGLALTERAGLSLVAVDRRGSGRCRVHAQLSVSSARRKGFCRRCAGRRALRVESTSLESDSHSRGVLAFHLSHCSHAMERMPRRCYFGSKKWRAADFLRVRLNTSAGSLRCFSC
jgi:hypothetical protein